jgi:adenylate/nucleoside-diphosphate kinase
VAIPHGSVAQREFGVSFNGRIYTCANKKRLRRFIADPWRFVSPSADSCSLPQDLPLSVPLGSHLRSSVQDFAFDGYCPVTFAEGRGPRDWDSIVEGDPVSAVKYQGKTYAFANASQKHKFMRRPSAYIDLELPLKLPPKMKPMSLEQLKSGGLHGVLAVMEQSLSVATQNALLALGQARIKFPSLSVSESASKFVSLYLKSQNPNSKPEIRKRFASKLDVFINECSLAGYLKDNADVLAGTPRGSGIKAVRGLSDRKEDDKKAAYLQKASQFEMLCNEGQESLEERFLNP